MVGPETLAAQRDNLEVGSKIMAKVKVRRTDEEMRFSIEAVKPLSKAVVGSHDALCVRVNGAAHLDVLAEIARGQRTRTASAIAVGTIFIEIPLEDASVVTVVLDGQYPVDFGAMNAFKQAPGVDQVRPAAA
jgi:hypothetical protein